MSDAYKLPPSRCYSLSTRDPSILSLSVYHKFLYEPFPVESQLRSALADHLNAEVAAGSVRSRRDALDFLSWTYFYRRLSQNPAYYGLIDASAAGTQAFLEEVIDEALDALRESCCVLLGSDASDEVAAGGLAAALAVRDAIAPTTLGRIASYYCEGGQARKRSCLIDTLCLARIPPTQTFTTKPPGSFSTAWARQQLAAPPLLVCSGSCVTPRNFQSSLSATTRTSSMKVRLS